MPYKDKEKEKLKRAEYRKKFPHRSEESRRKWRKNNPDKVKEIMARSQKTFKQRLALLRKEKGGECVLCGYKEEINILQFHHLRDKKFNLSQQYKPLDEMKKEAEKCILICPNCHFLIHFKEKAKYYESE